MNPQATSTHVYRPHVYRPDVDGLRAVAVLAVVVFHAFPARLRGGFVGVDVFFVISGYLITSLILADCAAERFTIANFYSRRIRRIFPALTLVLVVVLTVGWLRLSELEYANLSKQALAGAAFVANLFFWSATDYFDGTAVEKPLLHLWSLGIEEQFYIVWPVVVAAVWRSRRNFRLLLTAFIVGSFALSLYATYASRSAAFYSPVARFWELAAGALLAYGEGGSLGLNRRIASSTLTSNQRQGLSIGGLVLILASMVLVDEASKFPGFWALLPVTGSVFLIAAGPGAVINRWVLSNRLMVGIGLISYPLYLWHWPLLSFARVLYVTPGRTTILALVGASFVLAWLTHVLLERPLKRRSAGRTIRVLVVAMVVTGLVAFFVLRAHGVPGRFPAQMTELAAFRYDCTRDYREGECFLRSEQGASAFGQCVEDHGTSDARLILLWGDSHAAHLYPGLRAHLDHRTRLAQFTASGCPPLVDATIAGRENCLQINQFVLAWVQRNKPDQVILAANWLLNDPEPISRTIDVLRAQPDEPEIVLLGPVPVWEGNLPRVLLTHLRHSGQPQLPMRLLPAHHDQVSAMDRRVEERARTLGVEHVSLLGILCEASGCLTNTEGRPASITAWDASHLTRSGSVYIGERLLERAQQTRPGMNQRK